ncbi:UDP-GalNAc:beta-1,3-N-acetylgalactosaminyltransferase 2-like isoform X2 [Ptychodera flava]|uniref:UDP-GalNAc:beta-1, 3-N-acetylgalactosaminyltransferase 2-like isoform X2 n=1 Tax=Ptychodera flava TaxID=63121 RepID=UPI00396A944A
MAHFQLRVLLVVALSAFIGILQTRPFTSVWRIYDIFHKGFTHYDFVIGIVSARENWELRQTLRETWLTAVSEDGTNVLVKFIIGSQVCDIAPSLRQNEYECDLMNITHAVLDKELQALEVHDVATELISQSRPLGQDFLVNLDIVVTRLGIFDHGKDGIQTAHLKVKLYDTIGQEEIVSVEFHGDDPGLLIGQFRFKVIEPYVLPKGFKGTIVAENFTNEDPAKLGVNANISVNDGGGAITFRKGSRFGTIEDQFPVIEETLNEEIFHYIAGNFMFVLHGSKTLTTVLSQQNEIMEDWKMEKKKEEVQLREEITKFNDIILVNEIDIYRNIPKKMLHFYKWTSEHVSFDFLLKTDDDCYIDMTAILQTVHRRNLKKHTRIWWSQFRKHWEINHYGKWTDFAYTASEYPAFACGSGYVLSSDLVEWISDNSMHLYAYQGEDTSLGIWLSALNPHYVVDSQWQCSRVCHTDMYSIPDNTVQQLQVLWENKMKCANPCGCR